MARLVKSLAKLRAQLNAAAPDRDKTSDGWIGDAAHASRPSDHNPEPDETVDALDIDHDPAHGCDVDAIFESIIASRDPRVKYLIRKGRICSGQQGPASWKWRVRQGKKPNTDHVLHGHISVLDGNQDDETPWAIGLQEDDMFEDKDRNTLDEIRDLLKEVVDAVNAGGTTAAGKNLDAYVKEGFDEVKKAIATLQTGGVDPATFAKAVATEIADRLKA